MLHQFRVLLVLATSVCAFATTAATAQAGTCITPIAKFASVDGGWDYKISTTNAGALDGVTDDEFVHATIAGADTWNEQANGLPDRAWDFPFRHALDVAPDGETLAFGTTSGNLYATSDGGASWEAVSNSLPLIYSVRFA